jgi:acetylglutamate kinase
VGKQSEFIGGLRVTDDETMEVVEMVLGGHVNPEIVELVGRAGGKAVGLTGKDGRFMRVQKVMGPGGEDLGRVGEPEHVDPDIILRMTQTGFIPVVAPIGTDMQGQTYNVNADVAAGRIAEAIQAEKLVLLTDVEGVLDKDGQLISRLDRHTAQVAIDDGTVQGGMIPKVECCIHAREQGVTSTHIIDGRIPHALLLEIFTDGGVGTLIAGAK